MLCYFVHLFSGGISRRMVRTPPGTYPLTDFTSQEKEYDDAKFIATPVRKGEPLLSLNTTGECGSFRLKMYSRCTVRKKNI